MSDNRLLPYAVACHEQGLERMTVWTPQGWKPPKGFPRRELLCCPTEGGNTWSISTSKLIRYLTQEARTTQAARSQDEHD